MGVHWLVGLYENGLNGILGDEMGLGKTVQSVALLAHLKEHNVAGPFMVVGPLSTLHNWKNEFTKWAPSMDAIIYHGPEKERAEMRGQFLRGKGDTDKKFPVLITSYEIVIRDAKHLKRCGWKFVIIDEGAPSPRPPDSLPRPQQLPARHHIRRDMHGDGRRQHCLERGHGHSSCCARPKPHLHKSCNASRTVISRSPEPSTEPRLFPPDAPRSG